MPRRKSIVTGSLAPTSVRLNATAVAALEFLQAARPFQSQGDILRESICAFATQVRSENEKLGRKPIAAEVDVADVIRSKRKKGGKR